MMHVDMLSGMTIFLFFLGRKILLSYLDNCEMGCNYMQLRIMNEQKKRQNIIKMSKEKNEQQLNF